MLLLAGPMLLFALTFLKVDKYPHKAPMDGALAEQLTIGIGIFALAILAHGIFYFYRGFRRMDKEVPVREKFSSYKEKYLWLTFFLFSANFIVVIGYFLTALDVYLIFYAVTLVTMTRFRPTLPDVIKKTKIKKEHHEKILNDSFE